MQTPLCSLKSRKFKIPYFIIFIILFCVSKHSYRQPAKSPPIPLPPPLSHDRQAGPPASGRWLSVTCSNRNPRWSTPRPPKPPTPISPKPTARGGGWGEGGHLFHCHLDVIVRPRPTLVSRYFGPFGIIFFDDPLYSSGPLSRRPAPRPRSLPCWPSAACRRLWRRASMGCGPGPLPRLRALTLGCLPPNAGAVESAQPA